MKNKFDENIHDKAEASFNEADYLNQQGAEEAQILRLSALLKENPKGCGEILNALYLEGKDYAELAQEMGVKEAALRQRKKRCLDKFRTAW